MLLPKFTTKTYISVFIFCLDSLCRTCHVSMRHIRVPDRNLKKMRAQVSSDRFSRITLEYYVTYVVKPIIHFGLNVRNLICSTFCEIFFHFPQRSMFPLIKARIWILILFFVNALAFYSSLWYLSARL